MIQRSFSTSIYDNKSSSQDSNAGLLLDKHNSILLPDTLRASVLLRRIGLERSWSQDQVNHDINILDEHRLYTVRDLLSLSDYSWKVIELLPLVKDLLRSSVDPNWMENVDNRKKKPNKKQKNKKTQPIITVGSPVYPGKLVDQAFLPTSPVTLSSSPPTITASSSSSFTADDKFVKPDEFDPSFSDMICDDPLTIRNTLHNLSCTSSTFDDHNDSPTIARSTSLLTSPKNVRFTDRNSIIMDDNSDLHHTTSPVPRISTTPMNHRSADTDSASSYDTVTTDEDEEALMTAAAAMVIGRSGSGQRLRNSTIAKDHFSTPPTTPIA